MSRVAAFEIASGDYSVICGGYRNEAAAAYAFVGGGENNDVSGPHGVIGGGLNNRASTPFCFIGGGVDNTCNQTSVICGGSGNVAYNNSSIGGGNNNRSVGNFGCIPGGRFAETREVWGKYAYTAITFSGTFPDAQQGVLVLGLATTNATIGTMVSSVSALIGLTPTPTNILVLQNYQAMAVRGQVICRRLPTQGDECSVWEFTGAIRRGINAAATSLVAPITPTLIAQDAGLAATVLTISADGVNGGLKVQGTGIAAFDLRWVCTLTTTEVMYA